LWTYVRDGTGWGSTDPPAVWYQYSPSWHGKYPQKHLASFEGKLQVDAYAGFEPLFLPTKPGVAARVEEISCMAHARRYFYEVLVAQDSPLAKEAHWERSCNLRPFRPLKPQGSDRGEVINRTRLVATH